MIEYGLSKDQLEQLNRFSPIFRKGHDQFVISCILVVLDIWSNNEDNLMGIDPDSDEVNFTINLPIEVETEIDELSDECDLSRSETINGVVGLVLGYIDESWDDESGLDFDNMTDSEKFDQILRDNRNDGSLWCDLFS
jgi:hypothetical protein